VHKHLVLSGIHDPKFTSLVDLTQLSDGLEELIGGAGELRFEEGKPKYQGIRRIFKESKDLVVQIVIKNVFKINGLQFVSPRMQNLETFVRHVLFAIPLDIFLDEFVVSLISLDGIT
jgi:hypothetical protein